MINYKPTANIPKGLTLEPEKIREFLKLNKPGTTEFDPYDDMIYFDDSKVKEIVLRQNFLIAKGRIIQMKNFLGYFDPKTYFPSINLTSLDDTSFDDKIKGTIFVFIWKKCWRFQIPMSVNKMEKSSTETHYQIINIINLMIVPRL